MIGQECKIAQHQNSIDGINGFFLQMLKKGIAYRKKAPVNWCPKCNTVLANEQVTNGKCWRHEETEVEIKHLKQWYFKITDYADELYTSIDDLKEWPEKNKSNAEKLDWKVSRC